MIRFGRRLNVALGALGVMLAQPLVAEAAAQDGYAIVFNTVKDDGGFNEAANAGAKRAQAELGIAFRERVTGNADQTADALRAFASRGVGNLVAISFLNEQAVADVAGEFPDARFTLIDGVVEADNVRSVHFNEDEAGFLAGAAAGLKTESDTLAFIGALSIPPIQRYGCGFIQGVAATNPDATVLVRILGDDASVFRDRDLARTAAEALIAEGADIVFPAAGMAGEGALDAIANAGGFGIGVDVNQNGYNDRVLTSAVKRVDQAVFLAWSDAAAGTWTAGRQRLGIADDAVDWAVDDANADLVADIRETVDALKAEIAANERSVLPVDEAPACAGL
ncbi:BMP family ABC transporter substrate-binding protein [uncultured Rhodospira sp.]|uniref:BMP family lipoprotein n=1 Tax=uncultured Rhodospira sp. TaxID=1936189 RepID=UPI00261D48D6|nr:BMP family ABC transporter substrate-binding protein [uncultured Rhodospira sp.]